jgi:hypothetical protein
MVSDRANSATHIGSVGSVCNAVVVEPVVL